MNLEKKIIQNYIKFYIGDMYKNNLDLNVLFGEHRAEIIDVLEAVCAYMFKQYDDILNHNPNQTINERVIPFESYCIDGLNLWSWCKTVTYSGDFVYGTINSDPVSSIPSLIVRTPVTQSTPIDTQNEIQKIARGSRVIISPYSGDHIRALITDMVFTFANIKKIVVSKPITPYAGIDMARIKVEMSNMDIRTSRTKPIWHRYPHKNFRKDEDNTPYIQFIREIERFVYWYYGQILRSLTRSQIVSNSAVDLLYKIIYHMDWKNIHLPKIRLRKGFKLWAVEQVPIFEEPSITSDPKLFYRPQYITNSEVPSLLDVDDFVGFVIEPIGTNLMLTDYAFGDVDDSRVISFALKNKFCN